MDVVMPEQSGIEGVPLVLKEAPEAKVLVLSMQDDPRYVREAFAAGASGYVLKEAVDAEVVAAVREVARGGRYVHPALGARLVAAEAEATAREEADPLSEREREVMRLLALGHTNQEIAKMLYISVRTAETHRAHIMQKLRLSTRAELVRYAIDQGLLEEGEANARCDGRSCSGQTSGGRLRWPVLLRASGASTGPRRRPGRAGRTSGSARRRSCVSTSPVSRTSPSDHLDLKRVGLEPQRPAG